MRFATIFGRAIESTLEWPRWMKRLTALMVDAVLCVFSVWLAFYLRLGFWPNFFIKPLLPAVTSVVLALPLFVWMGFYRAIFRYAGLEAMITLVQAMILYAAGFSAIYLLVGVDRVPRTVGLIQPILLLLFVGASRFVARGLFQNEYLLRRSPEWQHRVLIYGAGQAGSELSGSIQASKSMYLVGIVDDDDAKVGLKLRGLPIFSSRDLKAVIARNGITDVLLAIPSLPRHRRLDILQTIREMGVSVRMLPSMADLAKGNVQVTDLRHPELEDLLGRTAIPPDWSPVRKNIEGRTIMVTGAGGSIGSELCRQILSCGPAVLLLVDHSEYNLYAIEQELGALIAQGRPDAGPVLVPLLASVTNANIMATLIGSWKPSAILHAAAYKHVPLIEQNILEGISNNIIGTLTIAEIASANGVEALLLVSTDKAVRPTNVMGATKRLAEMICQAMQERHPQMIISMVRFGNVLGSSGSVVPLFRKQIAAGGPITITHPDITRYFMTIPEAAQLVLQASAMARGGEVFVLDMGEPVRIYDLARNMVVLSGLKLRDAANPDGDIAISVQGLRPGEKLYEELLIGNATERSAHPRIFRASEAYLPWPALELHLNRLRHLIDVGDAPGARACLAEIIPEFQPNSALADLVHDRRSAERTALTADDRSVGHRLTS